MITEVTSLGGRARYRSAGGLGIIAAAIIQDDAMSALIERGRRARRNGSPESPELCAARARVPGSQLAGASLLDSLLRDGAIR